MVVVVGGRGASLATDQFSHPWIFQFIFSSIFVCCLLAYRHLVASESCSRTGTNQKVKISRFIARLIYFDKS